MTTILCVILAVGGLGCQFAFAAAEESPGKTVAMLAYYAVMLGTLVALVWIGFGAAQGSAS